MAVTSKTQRKAGSVAAKAAARAAKGGVKAAASPAGAKAVKGGVKMTAYLTAGAAADKVRGAAMQVVPVGQRAGTVAAQSFYDVRVWTAPRLDEAADVMTGTVAPKVAAALRATARRVEPRPQRKGALGILTDWRAILGVAGIAAAAGTGAAYIRRRGDSLGTPPPDGQQADGLGTTSSSTPANPGSQ